MKKKETISERDAREAIEFQRMDNQTITTVRMHINKLIRTYMLNNNELVLKLIGEWRAKLKELIILEEEKLITNN